MIPPNREAASSQSGGDNPTPVPFDELAPGASVGPYIILDRLGRGGMGTVYRARHTHLQRIVALKLLAPALLYNQTAILRFYREMQVVGRIDHPHVVRATDAGSANGRHYLALEYLAGVTLNHLVQMLGPLPSADACELVRQAALGLQGIHEHSLVHRDVKPSNLLVDVNGRVRVLDLGLAMLTDPHLDPDELTSPGQVLGTADYLAPEQGSASHGVDIRADIYSLGCTLYKLLTGQVLFPDPSLDSLSKKARAHAEWPRPSVRASRPDVPLRLEEILNKMLAREPADRFSTPAEVAVALLPFAQGAQVGQLVQAVMAPSTPAEGEGPRQEPSPSKVVTTPDFRTPPTSGRAWPRSAILAAILLPCLILAVALTVYLLSRPVPDPNPEPTPIKPVAAVPSGGWQPLLTREPTVLRWPKKPGNSRNLYRAAEQEVMVNCTGLGLLRLGESSAPRYRVAVTLHQTPWAGNIGLFFGHQTVQLPQQPAERYQVIMLVRTPTPGPGQMFRLAWFLVHHIGQPGRQRQVTQDLSQSPAFRLPAQERTLELIIGPAGLEEVLWGDALSSWRPAASKPPEPAAARGGFGIYLENGGGIFSNARYRVNEEK